MIDAHKRLIKFFRAYWLTTIFSVVGIFFLTSYVVFNRYAWSQKKLKKYGYQAYNSEIQKNLFKKFSVELVSLKTNDDLGLKAWWVERNAPRGSLVLCHGYRDSKEDLASLVTLFPDFNIIIFDFRAHGQSDGVYTTFGDHEYQDVLAALDFVKEKTKSLSSRDRRHLIIGMGFSMGAAALLKAATMRPIGFDALVLDSMFADLPGVLSDAYNRRIGYLKFPVMNIAKRFLNYYANADVDGVRPLDWVAEIRTPMLFIHSSSDAIIPASDSCKLYSAAKSADFARMWVTPACLHAQAHRTFPYDYRRKVIKFLTEHVVA